MSTCGELQLPVSAVGSEQTVELCDVHHSWHSQARATPVRRWGGGGGRVCEGVCVMRLVTWSGMCILVAMARVVRV